MHIGLNQAGGVVPEDWPLIEDLGATWIKNAVNVHRGPECLRHRLEDVAEHGGRNVVDLRFDLGEVGETYRRIMHEQRGEDTLAANLRQYWLKTMDWLGGLAYQIVESCADLCQDWEIQGEFTCPAVTRGDPYLSDDYSLYLATISDAIKQAQPKARVWTGGSGVTLGLNWLHNLKQPEAVRSAETGALMQMWFPKGVADRFEVVNWHHYGHTSYRNIRDFGLAEQIAVYDEAFTAAAAILPNHWVASTEWGLPVVADAEGGGLWGMWGKFTSAIDQTPVVCGIPERLIGEWFEASLACFARHQFQVLCVHSLRDLPGKDYDSGFWGAHCGLVALDGHRRPSFEVVQKWACAARDSGKEPFTT